MASCHPNTHLLGIIINGFIVLSCHMYATKLSNQYPVNTASKSACYLISCCCNHVCSVLKNDTVYLRMQHIQAHGGLNLVREVTQARKWNPLSDLDNILHRGRHLRRNHLRKFWWRSVERFMGGGGQILPYPICFRRRPCNILALSWSCECVISSSSVLTEVKHKTVLCCELKQFHHHKYANYKITPQNFQWSSAYKALSGLNVRAKHDADTERKSNISCSLLIDVKVGIKYYQYSLTIQHSTNQGRLDICRWYRLYTQWTIKLLVFWL